MRPLLSGLLCAVALAMAACSSAPVRPAGGDVVATPLPARVAPRLGLALGGGAARGFAHVGVIAVLEEAGIKADLVVGTSAGSLVAALYASGKSAAELRQVASAMEEATFADWSLASLSRGALRGEALARYVNDQLAARLIETLPMPLGIVATDLRTGQGILFQRGDAGTAVRASSAVPSLFLPVKISGNDYVDGGLVAPVPVRYARQMGADLVLAVDISSAPEGNSPDSLLQILLQTFAIMGKSINDLELPSADLVIRPALTGVKSGDFAARQRSIEAGRAAMQQALPKLLELMATREGVANKKRADLAISP